MKTSPTATPRSEALRANGHGRGRVSQRARSMLLVGVVTLLLGVVMLAASGTFLTGVATASTSGSNAPSLSPPPNSLRCNGVGDPSPSALYTTVYEPKVNLSIGGHVTGTMEFAVVNYTSADLGVALHFPTVFFSFPLTPSGTFSITLSPQVLSIAGSGWTNGAHTNHTSTAPAGLNFPVLGIARMSTQKISIQANVPYGNITMEFRWMWNMTQPGGMAYHSPWTVPKSTWGGGSVLPSIFFPAQYIQFVSGEGNGQSLTIGTNYTAVLGGPVGGAYFFLETENGAGMVVNSHGQTFPANVTNVTVTIMLLNYDNYLPPGSYLVHIHDACGAILYNKLIKAVFAPSATVTFYLQPSFCGPMTFNGTQFANGTSGKFVPTTTPYAFTVPKCIGHPFKTWLTTGALHITSGQLMISYNGTFTIFYN